MEYFISILVGIIIGILLSLYFLILKRWAVYIINFIDGMNLKKQETTDIPPENKEQPPQESQNELFQNSYDPKDDISIGLKSKDIQKIYEIHKSVEHLNNIFLRPHVRGKIGETLLEELIRSWLPSDKYSFQYTFKDNQKVDAAIFIGKYIVPIDSKFPLESIKSLLKKEVDAPISEEVFSSFSNHINSIREKYIRPQEGTFPFALMYVPSEKIFISAFAEEDTKLLNESLRKKVLPVSPSTLFVYIQTIIYGLRGFTISQHEAQLQAFLFNSREEIENLIKNIDTSFGHLKNFQTKLKDIESSSKKLHQSVEDIINL